MGETDTESATPAGVRWAEEGLAGWPCLGSVVPIVSTLCGDGCRVIRVLHVCVHKCCEGLQGVHLRVYVSVESVGLCVIPGCVVRTLGCSLCGCTDSICA